MLALALGLALAAQAPAAGWGWVRPVLNDDGEPRAGGLARFVPDDGGEPSAFFLHEVVVILESDPSATPPMEAALDRRGRFEGPIPPSDGAMASSPPRLIIRAGIPASRWARAVDASAELGPPRDASADPPAPDPFLRALVTRGLADRRYKARRLAGRLLVAHGEAAVPALLEGLRSPDPEVVDRSLMALCEIQTGTIDP